MKYRVILFQPKLRKFVLDIGNGLEHFEFLSETNNQYASTKTFYKTRPSSFEKEINRVKITLFQRLRRLLPIPNIRLRFEQQGDLLFTYGCLLITNKPYVVWLENGAATHGYDPLILRNPFAKFFLIPFVLDPHLKHLVFMSEAAQKSFFSTLGLTSGWLKKKLADKSVQLYPRFPEPVKRTIKHFDGMLSCLFTGVYYMKGGRETLQAFQEIRREHQNISLTVLTPLHLLHTKDRRLLEETEGVTLIDATLQRSEMEALYEKHQIFLFPSFKDTFGLVLIEALSFGMPIIATDQYAVTEMVQHKYNGFVFPNHPFTDYDRESFFMYGKYYDARFFYQSLFTAQRAGDTKILTIFLKESLLRYYHNPGLIKEHSRHSYDLYDKKFRESLLRRDWDKMLLQSIHKT